MPLKVANYQSVLTQVADKPKTGRDTRHVERVNGLNIGLQVGGVNKLISSEGCDMVTLKGLTRAPIQGASGESFQDINFDSAPDSMTLVLLNIPGVRGNIVGNVLNGNGIDLTGEFSGRAGEVVNLHQELWRGEGDAIVVAQRDFPKASQPVAIDGVLLLSEKCFYQSQVGSIEADFPGLNFSFDNELLEFDDDRYFRHRIRLNMFREGNQGIQFAPDDLLAFFPKDPREDAGEVVSHKVLVSRIFVDETNSEGGDPSFLTCAWYDFTGEETNDGLPGLVPFAEEIADEWYFREPLPLNPLQTTRNDMGGACWQIILTNRGIWLGGDPPFTLPYDEYWFMVRTEYTDGEVVFSPVSRVAIEYGRASDFQGLSESDVYSEFAGLESNLYIRSYDLPRLSNVSEPGEFEIFSEAYFDDLSDDPAEIFEIYFGDNPGSMDLIYRYNLSTDVETAIPSGLPAVGIILDTEYRGVGVPTVSNGAGIMSEISFNLFIDDGFDDDYKWFLKCRIVRESGTAVEGRHIRFKRVPAP